MTDARFEPFANDAHTEYARPATSRGSSRGQAAYIAPRKRVRFRQNLAFDPPQILEGFHGAQTQESFYEQGKGWMSHSMRSTRDRGMNAIPRWPNTLPWAHDKVVYAKESSGAHTRVQPRRVSYLEDPGSAGVAETAWMPKTVAPTSASAGNTTTNGLGLGAVTRTTNPFINAVGRVNSTARERSRRKMPYTLDNRTFSEYVGAKDTGINGIEALLLHDHHLLPNTDERRSEYAGQGAQDVDHAPQAATGALMPGEAENAAEDIVRQDDAALRIV